MISAHFPLSFLIKIGMFFPTVIVPCSWRSGSALRPPVVPGQNADGVQGAKTLEALEILHLPKMPKIHPRGPFTPN